MEGYPNSDEEFELMYGDDFEVLREQNDVEKGPKKSCASPKFASQNTPDESISALTQNSSENALTSLTPPDDSLNTNKRSIEDLFGDIDDILNENQSKRPKTGENGDELALIEHIIELRKLARQRDTPEILNKDYTSEAVRNRNNLSYSVPKYPFIPVNRHDNKRVYIRFHSEEFEEEERLRITQNITQLDNLIDKKIWDEAQEIVIAQSQAAETILTPPSTDSPANKNLWVELYKPKKYFELLSDEGTNRVMLRWLKLWDKVVFKRRPKPKPEQAKTADLITDLDADGRPHHKVALLCGPPGLGKTTLAHMVARHAGYNPIEMNASDDRNVEAFRTVLENATQMKSVLDREKRPNCVIFDEIDGAPAPSIDFLVKFVQGAALKGRKAKTKDKGSVLRRPIICICNDAYVPALRPLRQIAFILNFPATSNLRLAQRLMEIARWQHIQTNSGSMLALAEKSNNDIRACLSVLHFFKAKGQVTLSDVSRASVGLKDSQKGLFSVWQDIFLIGKNKNSNMQPTLKERADKILKVVNSFGDYDKIAQGVFENYINLKFKNENLASTCQALDWFCFNDLLNKQIYSLQDYSLAGYLQYAFVTWHFVFGCRSWQKLQYPNVGFEVRMKGNKQKAIIQELMRGIHSTIRPYVQTLSLKLDILPLLAVIIVPTFRPINLHLYTEEEKKSLDGVVNVMIDYNLNYVQERTPDGNYVYKLDPDINGLASFGPKSTLSYSNKQLIAKEIETQKMRRFEHASSEKLPRVEKSPLEAPESSPLPNHLQTLRAKSVSSVETATSAKDFFGRPVVRSSPSGKSLNLKNDVWYQYKEGYNNAVRKTIVVASLK